MWQSMALRRGIVFTAILIVVSLQRLYFSPVNYWQFSLVQWFLLVAILGSVVAWSGLAKTEFSTSMLRLDRFISRQIMNPASRQLQMWSGLNRYDIFGWLMLAEYLSVHALVSGKIVCDGFYQRYWHIASNIAFFLVLVAYHAQFFHWADGFRSFLRECQKCSHRFETGRPEILTKQVTGVWELRTMLRVPINVIIPFFPLFADLLWYGEAPDPIWRVSGASALLLAWLIAHLKDTDDISPQRRQKLRPQTAGAGT